MRIEIELNNSAGIFQVDDLLATKIRGTPLEGRVEVVAKIEGETEKRLLTGFRLQLKRCKSVRRRSLRFSSLPWISDITIGRIAKKAITPKQKKVTVLSVVGPARPTPLSAIAPGASSNIVARIEASMAAARFTGGNLAHGGGVQPAEPLGFHPVFRRRHRMRRQ